MFSTGFHNHLIWLKFNPKYFMQTLTYRIQIYSPGMLKVGYIVYLGIYIHMGCICKNNTVSHSTFGQQLSG